VNILAVTANQLFPHTPTGGEGIFFANFLRNLQPHAGRIVVVAPRGYLPEFLLRLPRFARHRAPARQSYFGIEVWRPAFPSLAATKRLWLQARLAAGVVRPLCRRLHERSQFDLVLGHGLDASAQTAICVARDLGLSCVNWAIGGDVNVSPGRSAENAALLRHVVRYSNLVLTFSDALRRAILLRCPRARHVHTFYWGTDLGAVVPPGEDRAAGRRALGLEAGATYMLCAGHAAATKGTGEFYEAFRMLAGEMPSLRALWVGDGPEAKTMRDRARGDGLAGRLLVTGYVSRAEVLRYMHAADVMAFATHAEGLPNVVLEALASGLPVVTTPVGGIPEVVADGRTGRLVPVKDARALAAAVGELLRDGPLARELARRGREFVLRHLDGRVNARIALDIFRQAAAGGPSDTPMPVCAHVPPGVLPMRISP
jgi:glycosyltransferase involved in cell wall biosynthesis